MAPKPSFESMFSNPFFGNNSLKDFNQNPDVNFYNDISSLGTNYFSPSKIGKNFHDFSKESFSVVHLNITSMNKNLRLFKIFTSP